MFLLKATVIQGSDLVRLKSVQIVVETTVICRPLFGRHRSADGIIPVLDLI